MITRYQRRIMEQQNYQQLNNMFRDLFLQSNANNGEIEKLQGKKNYKTWLNSVKQWAVSAGSSDILELRPDRITEDQRSRVALVKTKILSTIDNNLHNVLVFETPLELLNELEKRFDKPSSWDTAKSIEEFFNLKMKPDEDLEMFILKFDAEYARLVEKGISFEDSVRSYRLLKSLPNFLDSTQNEIQNIFADSTINYEEIKTKLRVLAAGKSPGKTKSVENAFNVRKTKKVKCYKCGDLGHMKKSCTAKVEKKMAENKSNEQKKKKPKRKTSNHAHQVEQENSSTESESSSSESDAEQVFLSAEKYESKDRYKDWWLIDSGATHHFSNNLNEMQNIQKRTVNVQLASGITLKSNNTGDVSIVDNNKRIKIIGARHVPQFKTNLFSVPAACDRGNVVVFSDKNCKIMDKNVLDLPGFDKFCKISADRTGNAYFLKPNKADYKNYTDVFTCVSQSPPWHERLGHVCAEKLSAITGKPKTNSICGECKLSKCTSKPHPSTDEKFNLMDRISADILGPIPESDGGFRYVLHLVEHYSSFGGVYTIKTKDESVMHIINFINFCENQTERKLKQFLSDNGREFVNYQLETYLSQKGVDFLTTTPYKSQQNGKIERRNRTLMDCARTMLKQSGMPDEYWPFAIRTANYLINRWPSKKGDIPYEKFTGKKASYDHLRVFGCLAYWRVNNNMRSSKLDRKGNKMIFVGYSKSTKNYLLLDPRANRTVKTCDVDFDEAQMGYQAIMGNNNVRCDEIVSEHSYSKTSALNTISTDVISYKEAINSDEAEKWVAAMRKELDDLTQKGVYTSVDQVDKKLLSTKWVLRRKPDGRYKARLVVRGFEQFGSTQTYAPTLDMTTLRTFLMTALNREMKIKQFDISTAFLYSDLESEIYVKPPQGVNDEIWKLNKALYGLKEAPRAWYKTLKDFLVNELNLKCSLVDQCIFYSEDVMLVVYVDDIIIAAKSENDINYVIGKIKKRFDIHDFADCSLYLGLNINVNNDRVTIDQKNYIVDVLERFNMGDCNPSAVPMDAFENFNECERTPNLPIRELLGCLNYISTRTRPDISLAVSHLGTFMDKPSEKLWKAAKRVLRYLKGTMDYKLTINKVADWRLKVYTDASFRSDAESRATSGVMILINNNVISWSAKKQQRLAQSTCEAELVAALDGWKQAEPLRQLLEELAIKVKIDILIDNTAAETILRTGAFKRSRYFDYDQKLLVARIHENKSIDIQRIPTDKQLADGLTKPLNKTKLMMFNKMIFN